MAVWAIHGMVFISMMVIRLRKVIPILLVERFRILPQQLIIPIITITIPI